MIPAGGKDTGTAVAMVPKGEFRGRSPLYREAAEQIPVGYGGTAVVSGYDAKWGAADESSGSASGRIRVYDVIPENPFQSSVYEPVSTLSVDVDTASYSNMRRFINMGVLPGLPRPCATGGLSSSITSFTIVPSPRAAYRSRSVSR